MDFFGDTSVILNSSPLSIARVSQIVKDVIEYFFISLLLFFFFRFLYAYKSSWVKPQWDECQRPFSCPTDGRYGSWTAGWIPSGCFAGCRTSIRRLDIIVHLQYWWMPVSMRTMFLQAIFLPSLHIFFNLISKMFRNFSLELKWQIVEMFFRSGNWSGTY